ncbi:hypothetical protein LZ554_007648 [Drepanopeziza brunnea f. sp. 'monogermtubi']|nr:hypothetical protein LZ554_007648 [Drepanopeziza brunnea f. sp. 'monogermtubi']
MATPIPIPPPPPTTLTSLPSELLLHTLSSLDIPDLLALRALSLDPLLHTLRRHRAALTLQHSLAVRPALTELMQHRIFLTRTTLAARRLGRSLVAIQLNRRLQRRPSAEELVGWGVLPWECVRQGVSGSLVVVKRQVERERVKDALRGWVAEWRRRGAELLGGGGGAAEEARIDVRRMARRFAREGREERRDGPRWGAGVVPRKGEEPTRALVLGLRRFWERVGRESGAAGRPVAR